MLISTNANQQGGTFLAKHQTRTYRRAHHSHSIKGERFHLLHSLPRHKATGFLLGSLFLRGIVFYLSESAARSWLWNSGGALTHVQCWKRLTWAAGQEGSSAEQPASAALPAPCWTPELCPPTEGLPGTQGGLWVPAVLHPGPEHGGAEQVLWQGVTFITLPTGKETLLTEPRSLLSSGICTSGTEHSADPRRNGH